MDMAEKAQKKTKTKAEQFAVIGLGTFGMTLSVELMKSGKEVLAVDVDADRVHAAAPFVTHAVTADAADESVLDELDFTAIDAVVVCVGELEASVLITLGLVARGVERIVVRSSDARHRLILEKIGATEVVQPEADTAKKVAGKLVNRRLNELMELNDRYSIMEITPPTSWTGKSLKELDIRNAYGVNVILVLLENGEVIIPTADTEIAPRGAVVVGGRNEDIPIFIKKLEKIK